MENYTLSVYFSGETRPSHVESLSSAQQVFVRIPLLLETHSECEKVVVMMGPTRLFSVDCKGNSLPT